MPSAPTTGFDAASARREGTNSENDWPRSGPRSPRAGRFVGVRAMARALGLMSIIGGVLAFSAGAAQADVPAPSSWSGQIAGTAFGQAFSLPVSVSIAPPVAGDANPVFVGISTGSTQQVGYLLLNSAAQVVAPYTGRTATLDYFALQVAGSQITGTLNDNHTSESAVLANTFDAPNLSCTYQPLVCVPGPEELYFNPGATLALTFSGSQLTGTIQGTGTGLIQIEPWPQVTYTATLTATRTDTPVTPGPVGGAGPAGPGGGSAPVAAANGTPALGRTHVSGTKVSVPVTCTGNAGASCGLTLALTDTATVRGGKVIAVSAADAHGARAKHRTVVLGTATLTLSAGQSKTVPLALNRTGKRLLVTYRTLTADLVLSESGKPVSTATVTFAARHHNTGGH